MLRGADGHDNYREGIGMISDRWKYLITYLGGIATGLVIAYFILATIKVFLGGQG